MPYKTEKKGLYLPEGKDRRKKLTDQNKEEIKKLYGQISQRKLAKMYNVSRRLIQFIGDEKKAEQNKLNFYARGGWRRYYNQQKHAEAMKEHRKYKYNTMKEVVENE